MKTTIKFLSLAGTALFALSATAHAEEGDKKGKRKLPPEVIEKFDTDGNGKLDEDERQAAREARKEKMQERRAKILEEFDADGNGELNEDERKAAREAMQERRGDDGFRRKGPGGKKGKGPGKGGPGKG